MNVNGCRRGRLNWFAPAACEGERDEDVELDSEAERSRVVPGISRGFVTWVGEAGKLVFGGSWKGASVGDTYLREGECAKDPLASDSSSMGVIGGGGVSGGEGDLRGFPRRGDDSTGVEVERILLGLRER